MGEYAHYLKHTNHGYQEHLVIGALIGCLFYYLVYKKTSNNLKAWIISMGVVTFIGLAKEIVDPLFGRERDIIDLTFTVIGGAIGAIVVFFLIRRKKDELL